MNNSKNISNIYLKILTVQIFIGISSCLCSLISGIVIGNFLDEASLASLGYVIPLNSIIVAFSSLFSGGSCILLGLAMGRGDGEAVDDIFSLTLNIGIISSVLLSLLIFIFSQQIVILCGARELYSETAIYVRALSIGYIPLILTPILTSLLQMSNKTTFTIFSTLLSAILVLLFDIAAVSLFSKNLLTVGIATSIAQIMVFVVTLLYTKKCRLFTYDYKYFDLKLLKELFKYGFPGAIVCSFYALRNIITNNIAATVGGPLAIAAMATVFSFSGILDGINVGMGNATKMLSSIYLGERDSVSLKYFMKYSCRVSFILCLIVLASVSLLSYNICSIFTNDSEVLKLAVFHLRCFALGALYNSFVMIFSSLYLNEGKALFTNIINLCSALIFPSLSIFILYKPLKIYGIFSSYFLGDLLTLIMIYIIIAFSHKKVLCNIDDLIDLPENFDIERKMMVSISSIKEVIDISKKVEKFCKDNGINNKTAMAAGLCIEEMAGNIVLHGFTKDRKKRHTIDIFVGLEKEKISIRIKDDCIMFDPLKRLGTSDEIESNIGIRLVKNIASTMYYQTTFGLNVLNIEI